MATKPLNYLVNVAVAVCLVQWSLGLDLTKYTKPSKEVGNRLIAYNPRTHPGFPHEQGFGHYYQGDILLRPSKKTRIASADPMTFDKWYNAIVPYVIEADFTEAERQTLQDAFEQYASKTCVRFVPRTNEGHFLKITNRNEGCYATLGRSPFGNELNLQTPGCMTTVGTPVHELMHALGFYHEQSRYDRDNYITINTANLAPQYQNAEFIAVNFGKYDNPSLSDYGVPYNYGSVMHYSRYAGAAGIADPVLDNKKPFFGDFGTEEGLTEGDIKQINARYC